MRANLLIENQNVKNANSEIGVLLKRPKTELPGIGLIYGQTGLGKTRYSMNTCFSRGWIYYSLLPNDNVKSFLMEIYARVSKQIDGVATEISGPNYLLEKTLIKKLQLHTEIVIMIDEFNHLFKNGVKPGMLETIRSIADNTQATILLVGEEDSKDRIAKYNRHLMNRCSVFCQFKPFSKEDYKSVLNGISEIEFDDEVIEFIFKETRGDFRSAVTLATGLESTFKGFKEVIKMSDLRG